MSFREVNFYKVCILYGDFNGGHIRGETVTVAALSEDELKIALGPTQLLDRWEIEKEDVLDIKMVRTFADAVRSKETPGSGGAD